MLATDLFLRPSRLTLFDSLQAQIASELAPIPTPEAEAFASADYETFCEEYLRIQDKNGDIVPLRLNRVQRHLIPNLTGRDLVVKARQVGVSTAVQARFYYLVTRGNVRTSTLCHEDDLTQEFRDMADRFHESIPEAVRPKRKYSNAKVTTYPLQSSRARIATVGGHAGAESAGKKKGRGSTSTHIHGSEVAFWPDADGVLSAAMQAGNPEIVLESTPNGMVGWFFERCMEALAGVGVWKLHFYEWWWEDGYRIPLEAGETLTYTAEEQALADEHGLDAEQIKWRRAKQAELPHTFKQEYPENILDCFLASGTSYFGDVEHVFTAPKDAEPIPGRHYVGGLDFAQTSDYLVQVIVDAESYEMVDMLRINKLKWQEMRRQISVMANKWNAEILGEANSMGSTNIELLQSGEVMEDGTKIAPVDLTAFNMTPSSKPGIIQGLYHALHEMGLRVWDDPVIKHELRAFISRQLPSGHWTYEAGSGATDDFIIAVGLAWHAINSGSTNQLGFAKAPDIMRQRRG